MGAPSKLTAADWFYEIKDSPALIRFGETDSRPFRHLTPESGFYFDRNTATFYRIRERHKVFAIRLEDLLTVVDELCAHS